MKIANRLTIAIHSLLVMEHFKETRKVTSDFIASSVRVNPVIIRRILLQLKAANIVAVTRGSGGTRLARSAAAITLLDIYRAVECGGKGPIFLMNDCRICASHNQLLVSARPASRFHAGDRF